MAFSAATVAGTCVGGVFFGLLVSASVIWTLLRRIRLPIRALFRQPYSLAIKGDDQAGLARLQDTYRRMGGGREGEVHHAQEVLHRFHFAIRNYVGSYLEGDGAGTAGSDQSALLDSLAGPQEDWRHLHEFNAQRRKSALIHFICRTLHRRIIPDGDLSITLLPVDILSTYQRILTKNPPPRASEFWLRRKTLMVQYWRVLTAYWCSEEFGDTSRRNLTRPNLMKMHCSDMDACSREDMHMADDDPRMPHLLATEDLLVEALSPFFQIWEFRREPIAPDLRADEPRRALRKILELAADIGFTAFASEEPNEFYWPPTNRRPGCDPLTNDGLLECFGVRNRFPSLAWSIIGDYEGGHKSERVMWDWWQRMCGQAPDGVPDQAAHDEFRKREKEFKKFRNGVPVGDFPGWEGRVFF